MKDILCDEETFQIRFEKTRSECFYIRLILKELGTTILFEQYCFSKEGDLKHPLNERIL